MSKEEQVKLPPKHSFKYRVINSDRSIEARKVLDAFQLEFEPSQEISSLELFDFVTKLLGAQAGVTLG